jgi:hypothetical protein
MTSGFGNVILSEAKDLVSNVEEILRFAQNDTAPTRLRLGTVLALFWFPNPKGRFGKSESGVGQVCVLKLELGNE